MISLMRQSCHSWEEEGKFEWINGRSFFSLVGDETKIVKGS